MTNGRSLPEASHERNFATACAGPVLGRGAAQLPPMVFLVAVREPAQDAKLPAKAAGCRI